MEYKRRGRRQAKAVKSYTVKLCIVIIKEKIKKAAVSVPTSVSVTFGGEKTAVTSNSGSGGGTIGQKRKAPLPFIFLTTKLCISLHAPIETQEKQTVVITCVPAGKTNKEMTYDLSPFVIGRKDDGGDTTSNKSAASLDGEDEVADEDFDTNFTLSRFRVDLMRMAGENFAEEYGIAKKSLWPKCKLYIQKQWNSSSWTEIPMTEMLHRTLREQMATKARMKNGILQMRFSFGRAKAGIEFQTKRDRHNYVCEDFGEGIKFS